MPFVITDSDLGFSLSLMVVKETNTVMELFTANHEGYEPIISFLLAIISNFEVAGFVNV